MRKNCVQFLLFQLSARQLRSDSGQLRSQLRRGRLGNAQRYVAQVAVVLDNCHPSIVSASFVFKADLFHTYLAHVAHKWSVVSCFRCGGGEHPIFLSFITFQAVYCISHEHEIHSSEYLSLNCILPYSHCALRLRFPSQSCGSQDGSVGSRQMTLKPLILQAIILDLKVSGRHRAPGPPEFIFSMAPLIKVR